MRITTSYSEFVRDVKIIFDPMRLKSLGLELGEAMGSFWPSEMEDVLDFCAQNPEFHIVSSMGEGIFINRYDTRGKLFNLAEGDSDPDYMADRRHVYKWLFSPA